MNVLLLSTSEKTGGAAIACNRLMHALNANGVEAKMLVRDKQTLDSNVFSVNNGGIVKILNKWRFIWERGVIYLTNHFSKKNLFNVSIANTGIDISNNRSVKNADVLHIHWINQGFLSIKDIERLIKLGKPVVFTMHDQWNYTGICHYASGCNKFETDCSFCIKLLHSKNRDLAFKTQRKKINLFLNKNIALVGCSQWIANEAKKSCVCKNVPIFSIPNAIDVTKYSKRNKQESIIKFALPTNEKFILFGSCKVTDKRKGLDYLVAACKTMLQIKKYKSDDISIVLFGAKSDELEKLLPFPTHNVGYINSDEDMIDLYNAVDVFLIPSLEDNLPNTIMEAMSCGTPCVGFNIGGIPEMITHKQNGYVAKYQDAEDLARGIQWVLGEVNYDEISRNARKKVEDNYSEDVVASKYIELYQSML